MNVEIVAVLQPGENAAREFAAVGDQRGRRQVLRIGVDREPEQDQLDHRNADDHAEGQPVALELDEFLADDAEPAREREPAVVHRTLSCCLGPHVASCGLSSSLRVDFAHQVDEHVLEPGWTSRHSRPGSALNGASAASSRARSDPVTCSAVPNAATCSTAGKRTQAFGQLPARSSPVTSHVTSGWLAMTSAAVPLREQAARSGCSRACGSARLRPCSAC